MKESFRTTPKFYSSKVRPKTIGERRMHARVEHAEIGHGKAWRTHPGSVQERRQKVLDDFHARGGSSELTKAEKIGLGVAATALISFGIGKMAPGNSPDKKIDQPSNQQIVDSQNQPEVLPANPAQLIIKVKG